MTCYDCIHKPVCFRYGFTKDVEELCPAFKNKADFVEVVRCANCKNLVVYDNCCMYFGYKVDDNDFCSYAERKDFKE